MRFTVLIILAVCAFGCKQRRNDTPTIAEKIIVSPSTEGKKGEFVSERFGGLHVSVPDSDVKSALVLFSEAAWTDELSTKAKLLAKEGIFVIGVDLSNYLENISKQDDDDCVYLAGEIERLIQSVEKGIGIKGFVPAALTGEGAGAKLAEKIFYQHPESFFGLLSAQSERILPSPITFCAPDDSEEDTRDDYASQIKQSKSLSLNANEVRTLLAEIPATSGLATSTDLPQGVADLPLEILMPEEKNAALDGDTFAIFLSGDGGWASIDEALSDRLVDQNIPVVGISSLQYFWKKQSPLNGAKDLERIIHVYSGLLKRQKVALFGFSFGADVLPAFVANLTNETRAMVSKVVLLSPGLETDYEIHISEWVGFDESEGGVPILPEVRKLQMPILCLYGEEEKLETLCAVEKDGVKQTNLSSMELPGDHHFDGEYDSVAKAFLDFLMPKAGS